MTVQGSGFSPVAGQKNSRSNRKRNLVVWYQLDLDCGSDFLTAITRSIVAGSHSH